MRSIAVVVLAVAAARAEAGPCGNTTQNALKPLVQFGGLQSELELATGGGIVVALQPAPEIGSLGGTFPDQWKFRTGDKVHDVTIKTIAPGLFVYAPPDDIGDAFEVVAPVQRINVAPKGKKPAKPPPPELGTIAKVHRPAKPAPVLPAPRMKKTESGVTGYPFESQRITVTLADKAPAGAVALVTFGVDKTGVSPRSWASVLTSDGIHVGLYESREKCQEPIANTIYSSAGDSVAIAWLDASGRLGKLSAPFTVAK